jgi:hypothetical protein
MHIVPALQACAQSVASISLQGRGGEPQTVAGATGFRGVWHDMACGLLL